MHRTTSRIRFTGRHCFGDLYPLPALGRSVGLPCRQHRRHASKRRDGGVVVLASLDSDYRITISGDVADVTVTQTFSNPYSEATECTLSVSAESNRGGTRHDDARRRRDHQRTDSGNPSGTADVRQSAIRGKGRQPADPASTQHVHSAHRQSDARRTDRAS